MWIVRVASISAFLILAIGLAETKSVSAGEVVRGPIRVCMKPMLGGSSALGKLVEPGPDAWMKLAERQADEAKYCYVAGDIELVEKGEEVDGCTEWRATTKGDEVYVVIGLRDRAWGHCP